MNKLSIIKYVDMNSLTALPTFSRFSQSHHFLSKRAIHLLLPLLPSFHQKNRLMLTPQRIVVHGCLFRLESEKLVNKTGLENRIKFNGSWGHRHRQEQHQPSSNSWNSFPFQPLFYLLTCLPGSPFKRSKTRSRTEWKWSCFWKGTKSKSEEKLLFPL